MTNRAIVSYLRAQANDYNKFVADWEKKALPSELEKMPTDELEDVEKLVNRKSDQFYDEVERKVYEMIEKFLFDLDFDVLCSYVACIGRKLDKLQTVFLNELLRRERIEIEAMMKEMSKMNAEHARVMRQYQNDDDLR